MADEKLNQGLQSDAGVPADNVAGEAQNIIDTAKAEVESPIQKNESIVTEEQKIQAPFIGLVPIPSLLVDRVDIDFQMEVTSTETNKDNMSSDVSTNISSGWFVKAEISDKVSTSRENTRSTNQTDKYQVHVSASQQPQTEGLSKLMDIMASCIEPMPTKDTIDGTGGGSSSGGNPDE